jgi:hypothetical protein
MACGFMVAFLVKSKMQFIECVAKVDSLFFKYGHKMHKLRIDADKLEGSAESVRRLAEMHIHIDAAAPGEQQQNPQERGVQTVKKGMVAVMLDQNILGAKHWGSAMFGYLDARNCQINTLCSSGDRPMSPYEAVTRRQPDCEVFRFPFGQAVTVHRKVRVPFLVPKNEIGAVVGTVLPGNGRGMRVVLQGKGLIPYIRYNIQPLHLAIKKFTEAEVVQLQPIETEEDGVEVTTMQHSVPDDMLDNLINNVNAQIEQEEVVNEVESYEISGWNGIAGGKADEIISDELMQDRDVRPEVESAKVETAETSTGGGMIFMARVERGQSYLKMRRIRL